MTGNPKAVAAILLAGALALTGCADGGSTPDNPAPPVPAVTSLDDCEIDDIAEGDWAEDCFGVDTADRQKAKSDADKKLDEAKKKAREAKKKAEREAAEAKKKASKRATPRTTR